MNQYRKKPVVIEARQFETNNGNSEHMDELVKWINDNPQDTFPRLTGDIASHDGTFIYIRTLEGTMTADCKDWIIRGVKGEFYPCKPDIFEATHEPVVADTAPAEGSWHLRISRSGNESWEFTAPAGGASDDQR